MAHIESADYETFNVRCDHCSVNTLVNRVTDLKPLALPDFFMDCPACNKSFWVTGGVINSPYELFIFDSDRHFEDKRYMLSVASLALAWELFFVTFAQTVYLDRPFFRSSCENQDLEEARLATLFEKAISKFTFNPLRNLMINTIVRQVEPNDLQDAGAAIARLAKEGFGNEVSPSLILDLQDNEVRNLLLGLQGLGVGDLRNRALHRRAYRPNKEEAKACRREIDLLYQLDRKFDVNEFPALGPLSVRE